VAVGLGLAAACGFRVFVPLLALGIGARFGHLPLASGFAWVSSLPGLIAFGTATILEVGAYYVPWLDHVLDVLATPVAVLAGVLASASIGVDLPPTLRWAIALIAGGGLAGLTQGASVLVRAKSGLATGGLANPVVATGELLAASGLSALALLLPVVALVLVLLAVVLVFRWAGRLLFGRRVVTEGTA
jgi:hypothetical protein